MPSHQASNQLSDKPYTKMNCVTPNIDQESKDVELLKNLMDKISVLDSNKLALNSNQLPQDIDDLVNNITKLEIRDNQFSECHQLIYYFRNLKTLVLNNSMIESLNNEIARLQNLSVLNLSHNELTELPDNLYNLKNLQILDLSHNKLKNLPNSYGKLQRLKHLDISNNNFNTLPNCIGNGMEQLTFLNISQNFYIKINIIPLSKYLQTFCARRNKYCEIFPDWILITKFFNLKDLYLDETIFDIFSIADKERDLSIVNFSMCCSHLTDQILEKLLKNMGRLEKINVGNTVPTTYKNIFSNIPICVLKNPSIMKEINFCNTDLRSIPSTINQLRSLKKLDLSLNYISSLPKEFCELHELEYLKIDGNKLIMLPKNIGNLKLLKEIRAENNLLTELPKSFKCLQNLRFLDLYNNKFKEFPDVLFKMKSLQGLDVERNYFTTHNIKIKKISYFVLYKTYSSLRKTNSESIVRYSGNKSHSSIESEDSSFFQKYNNVSDNEKNNYVPMCTSDDIKENWQSLTDSDSEFEPGFERNYNVFPSKCTLDSSDGFCPADWHATKVTDEVASMCQYGLLPIHVVEEGQFDDA